MAWVSHLNCDIRRVRFLVCVHCGNHLRPVPFCNEGCSCGAAIAEVSADGAVLERG